MEARSFLSPADLIAVLVRRWRVVVLTPVVACGLAVLIALLLPPGFRSTASFLPESREPVGGALGALGQQAAALGLDVGGATGTEAPLYVDLLSSRMVRENVVTADYPLPSGESGTLVEYFDLEDVEPHAEAVEKAREKLGDATRAADDPASGIVSLSVTLRDPEMSQRVASRYLNELERFNTEQRTRSTRDRVEYLRRQLEAARTSLANVEDSLLQFLQRNRVIEGSPALQFRRSRLERQVTLNTGIVTRVQEQLEQSQLELLRETPTISVVDPPSLPQRRVSPRRKMIVLSAALAGVLLGLLLALVFEGGSRTLTALPPDVRARLDLLASRTRERLLVLGRDFRRRGRKKANRNPADDGP